MIPVIGADDEEELTSVVAAVVVVVAAIVVDVVVGFTVINTVQENNTVKFSKRRKRLGWRQVAYAS